jgi:hypothetical protein
MSEKRVLRRICGSKRQEEGGENYVIGAVQLILFA